MPKIVKAVIFSTLYILIYLALGCNSSTTKKETHISKIKIGTNTKIQEQNIIGKWSKIIEPNDQLPKGMVNIYEIILELRNDKKGAIAFFEKNGTDFPLTGIWEFKAPVLSIIPDSMYGDTPKFNIHVVDVSKANITIKIEGVSIEMKRAKK